MPLKTCHRTAPSPRERCRYADRLTDPECCGCSLATPNPPRRTRSQWLDRRHLDALRADLRVERIPLPRTTDVL